MRRSMSMPEIVTLHVQFRVVKRSGLKETQTPDGVVQPRRTDGAPVKVLARAS